MGPETVMRTNEGPACETTALARRRARHAGLCHHWSVAKAAAPHISRHDLKGWFGPYLGTAGRLPSCPRRRLLWLVAVRAAFHASRNPWAALRVSAAIWREAHRLRQGKFRRPLAVAAAPTLARRDKKSAATIPKTSGPLVIASDTCRSDVAPPLSHARR